MILTLTPRVVAGSAHGMAAPPPVGIDGRGGTIGRAPTSDLVLPDPRSLISSRHCTVALAGANFVLTDTSTNGTEVNGSRITAPHPLRDRDVIRIGGYEIAVSLAAGVVAPRPAARINLDSWERAPAAAGMTMQQPAGPVSVAEGGDAVSQLLGAAGIQRSAVDAPDAVVLAAAGALLRQSTAGLMAMTAARAKARTELGVKPAAASANPLKKPESIETVLAHLLAAPPAAAAAMTEVLGEIDAHQHATLHAMQGALRATLDKFAPQAIRQRGGNDAAKLWKAYETAFSADDGFVELFAQELAAAYTALSAKR